MCLHGYGQRAYYVCRLSRRGCAAIGSFLRRGGYDGYCAAWTDAYLRQSEADDYDDRGREGRSNTRSDGMGFTVSELSAA